MSKIREINPKISCEILLRHLIIVLGGISLGGFIWDLKFLSFYNGNQDTITSFNFFSWILIGILVLYMFWYIFSHIIGAISGLKAGDVLRRDVYTYLPLVLLMAFPIKYLFSASEPYYSYLANKYFMGVLIIPAGSMVVFLKTLLITDSLSICERDLRKRIIYYFLFTAIFVYGGIFSYYSIVKHINLNSGIDPLGLYSQAVWLFSNFEAPFSSLYNKNILADHMTPILAFLSPFYKIYSDPITLLILQSLFLSSGVFPIYWLAKDKLRSDFLAISLSIGYLLYPALQFANLYDFSPVNLATPLLLFVFYFFHKRAYAKYIVFLMLALFCKEDVVPIVFFLGIYVFFFEGKKTIGALTTILSIAWFYFAFWVFLPFITSGEYSQLKAGHFELYSHLGNNIGEIISTLFLHPVFVLKYILIPEKLGSTILLLLPLCFISLVHPPTFLIGFSMILGNMLSENLLQSSIRFYYTASITPFIFISSIYGLKFLLDKPKIIMGVLKKIDLLNTFSRSNLVLAFSSVILFSSIMCSALYGPLPYSLDPYSEEFFSKKIGAKAAREMFKFIPPDASVSAANNLGAHISNRENIYIFPYHYKVPEYVVVNLAKPYYGARVLEDREKFNGKIKELVFQQNYGIFFFKDGYTILKKDYNNSAGIKKIALTNEKPSHVMDIDLNDEINFSGYTLNTLIIKPKIPFRIIYFWKALKNPGANYYILVKFVDEDGRIVFEQDHEPVYGLYPTSAWEEKEKIKEVYWVELPITVHPGIYHIYVGLSETKPKLESFEETSQSLENLTRIDTINVQRY